MRNLIEPEEIAVVLTGNENKKTVREISKVACWIELRIDCFCEKFPGRNFCEWAKIIRNLTDAKIIGTVRWHRERQNSDFIISDKERIEIYQAIAEYVDFFDIEIKSKILEKVVKIARQNKKRLILSYHNFKKTPSCGKLISICDEANHFNPDIIKLATVVKTKKDLFNLVSIFVLRKRKFDVVIVPMGAGILERIVPIAFGSLFTYFAAEQKTAPGQPSLDQIFKVLPMYPSRTRT
ncbi:MAG: type I 3-dehydroquinate dehydratase [Candidatus Omnitrophica bacterium]|nr:type I 3-dehydroquinate dehydratase [Candidatus Omnitrophota bacterium]